MLGSALLAAGTALTVMIVENYYYYYEMSYATMPDL